MSRVGKLPDSDSDGVKVEQDGTGRRSKGRAKGTARHAPPEISVEVEDGVIKVDEDNEERETRAYTGSPASCSPISLRV